MLTIRPFDHTETDYQTFATIDRAAFPTYPISVEEWKHFDATRDPKLLFQREMIERDGVVVAYGNYGQSQWAFHPEKYDFQLAIHPDHEQADIRPMYFEHVMHTLASHDPLAICTVMQEGYEAYINFLHAMGFVEVMRTPMVELDVTTFDASRFAHIPAQMHAQGIRIVTLRELMETDPNWKQTLYDLDWELSLDVPSPEPPVQQTLEDWDAMSFNPQLFAPDGWFVALDGDRYVGMSHVWLNPGSTTRLYNSLTGVIQSYRRRGIATALKLRLIEFARQYGAKTMVTGNEENNPIFKLNMKLGFRALPAWINYEKPLRSDPAAP